MKKTTKLLKCSNPQCRKRFPVNLEKHQYRKERTCPFCRTTVQIRKSLRNWNPNPNWAKEKQQRQAQRKQQKLLKKKPEPIPRIFL